jgi:hypothetical protein
MSRRALACPRGCVIRECEFLKNPFAERLHKESSSASDAKLRMQKRADRSPMTLLRIIRGFKDTMS